LKYIICHCWFFKRPHCVQQSMPKQQSVQRWLLLRQCAIMGGPLSTLSHATKCAGATKCTITPTPPPPQNKIMKTLQLFWLFSLSLCGFYCLALSVTLILFNSYLQRISKCEQNLQLLKRKVLQFYEWKKKKNDSNGMLHFIKWKI
jgi:hypothetical protein